MKRTREVVLKQPDDDREGRSTLFRASYKATCHLGDFEALMISHRRVRRG
jgi:hypothetical protein